jgi:glycosyltransferase involved in cell wall biosynthesis
LIKVCANLSKNINNLKLLIIGVGSKLKYLKKLASDLNFNSAYFWGELRNTSISEVINIANVLALCSTYEGSPTVIKEALACNVPVVSTDVGDAKEVLSEFKGCMISKKELPEFEKALETVLNRKNVPDYRCLIKKYSYEKVSKETFAIYYSQK